MENPGSAQNKVEREIEVLWNVEGPYKIKNKKNSFSFPFVANIRIYGEQLKYINLMTY